MAAELNQKKTGHIVTLVLRQVKVLSQTLQFGSGFVCGENAVLIAFANPVSPS